MHHLTRLNQLWSAASSLAEITRSAQTYVFNVVEPITLYLHTSNAEVRVVRRPQPPLEVDVQLQAPFAWRIASEQDEAGVYFVAHRRPVVGGLAGASFTLYITPRTHLMLRLERVRLVLDHVDGVVEVPPPGVGGQIIHLPPAVS